MFRSLLLSVFFLAFAHADYADECPNPTGDYILKRGKRLKCRPFLDEYFVIAEDCLQECDADTNCGSIEIRPDSSKNPKFRCRKFSYCNKSSREPTKPDSRYCSYLKPRNCIGSWSDYGECSANCGGGVQTRKFSITTHAVFGGQCSHTDGAVESRSCGTEACPKSYEYVGTGFCRPSGCDVASISCRVNGFYKDNSNENECKDTCENTAECVGYAISSSAYSTPNRCFVHGGSSMNTPSGWKNFDRTNYEIGHSSGHNGVQCYRIKTTTRTLEESESKVAKMKSENNRLKEANQALRKALETLAN